MARRDRVTRLKSHRRKVNQNPKLSPFQREQKREKMANQVPIAKANDRDIPKSQRLVIEYLERKQQEKKEKKEQRLQERREREAGGSMEASPSSSSSHSASSSNAESKAQHEKKPAASLNALLGSSLGPAHVGYGGEDPASVNATIARKKEKKHQKRVEARRQRVKDGLEKMTLELESLTKKKKKKGEVDQNAVFEKQLIAMQREREQAVKAEAKKVRVEAKRAARLAQRELMGGYQTRVDEDDDDIDGYDNGKDYTPIETESTRKSITFDESVNEAAAKKPASESRKRARDFSELVDIVRFNDRVDAPPVFTVVPDGNAAVSRLANKLQQQPPASQRLRLLSSVGGLGEQKRLARLGLKSASPQLYEGKDVSKLSKQQEMDALRSHVMAAYRKNKNVENKKNIDLNHVFPSL